MMSAPTRSVKSAFPLAARSARFLRESIHVGSTELGWDGPREEGTVEIETSEVRPKLGPVHWVRGRKGSASLAGCGRDELVWQMRSGHVEVVMRWSGWLACGLRLVIWWGVSGELPGTWRGGIFGGWSLHVGAVQSERHDVDHASTTCIPRTFRELFVEQQISHGLPWASAVPYYDIPHPRVAPARIILCNAPTSLWGQIALLRWICATPCWLCRLSVFFKVGNVVLG